MACGGCGLRYNSKASRTVGYGKPSSKGVIKSPARLERERLAAEKKKLSANPVDGVAGPSPETTE